MPARSGRATVLLGLVAGFLNGMLGLGGGIVMAPGLQLWRGLPPARASGTSLAVVLLMSAGSLAAHLASHAFTFSPAGTALLLAVAAIGAQVGARLAHRVPQRPVLLAFAVLTTAAAVRLALTALGYGGPAEAAGSAPPLWSYAAFGALSGLGGGVLGLGGGGITVLAFSAVYYVPIVAAVPLALLLNVTNALSGTLAHWRQRRIVRGEAARLLAGAAGGVVLGTGVALALPADPFRLLFAAFFLWLTGRLVRRAWRRPGG